MTPIDLAVLAFAVIGFATVAPILLVMLAVSLFILALGLTSGLAALSDWLKR